MAIDSTAIISPGAVLAADVEVGPYAVIGPDVRLGEGCVVMHHANIEGPSTFGMGNVFHPFSSVGGKTQDLKYKGEPTFLEVGDNNTFREFCTVNRGTGPEEKTIIGNGNSFLSYTHVAHNCVVGNHSVFSNNATLGGHVTVEDHCTLGGFAAVHQFCRIGRYAMLGGLTKIVQDVPPYFIADGNPAEVRSVNMVGLQRRGFNEDQVRSLRQALKTLYSRDLNVSQALDELKSDFLENTDVQYLISFIQSSDRGIIR